MLRTVVICAALLGGNASASALEIKCSDPAAIALMEGTIRADLKTNLDRSDEMRAQAARAFPSGTFSLTLSEFLGTQADDTSRNCSARVVLASPGMSDGEYRFDYRVLRTEDDKILVTKDDRYLYALLSLAVAYDTANGLK